MAVVWVVDMKGGTVVTTPGYLVHEIPEPRLRNDLVRRKKLHAVCRRHGLSLGGGFPPNHLCVQEITFEIGDGWIRTAEVRGARAALRPRDLAFAPVQHSRT